MAAYEKPLPRITPDNAPFWAAARAHVLRLPRCRDCAAWHWPPGPVCPECFSPRIGWRKVLETDAPELFRERLEDLLEREIRPPR